MAVAFVPEMFNVGIVFPEVLIIEKSPVLSLRLIHNFLELAKPL